MYTIVYTARAIGKSNACICLQSKGFSKQVEDLCQHLLKSTNMFSADEAQDVILSLIETTLLVEKQLLNSQQADLMVKPCQHHLKKCFNYRKKSSYY